MDNFDFDFGAYEESAAEKEITLTEEQLDKLLLICEERVMARVKEEILKPIQEKLYSIYQKNAEVNEEIRELKEQVDYLYKPTKEEKRRAAAQRMKEREMYYATLDAEMEE